MFLFLSIHLQVPFKQLDPEEMAATTARYGKTVYQLEKGLPPNGVVPMLKDRVEKMREKVLLYATTVFLLNGY